MGRGRGMSLLQPRFIDVLFRCRSENADIRDSRDGSKDSSTISRQRDECVGARNAVQEVHDILATTMEDAERENALNLLREKLSALNLESVDLDVYRHMREDQIRKNEDEEHRQYRKREVELAEEAKRSPDQAPILASDILRHVM
ncbi:hypothetical protein ARMSODRAFT_565384 [Armillaria solidipes]|uniref:Uncharacterized protein n=1 Tax=Armillaria solidipes TaxID=1076256 RepID=A0A2H3CF61_9AGAR|nr:hypothetical protein ARMSODRAFT_565384 [Armillaria solidipes]